MGLGGPQHPTPWTLRVNKPLVLLQGKLGSLSLVFPRPFLETLAHLGASPRDSCTRGPWGGLGSSVWFWSTCQERHGSKSFLLPQTWDTIKVKVTGHFDAVFFPSSERLRVPSPSPTFPSSTQVETYRVSLESQLCGWCFVGADT